LRYTVYCCESWNVEGTKRDTWDERQMLPSARGIDVHVASRGRAQHGAGAGERTRTRRAAARDRDAGAASSASLSCPRHLSDLTDRQSPPLTLKAQKQNHFVVPATEPPVRSSSGFRFRNEPVSHSHQCSCRDSDCRIVACPCVALTIALSIVRTCA
jgi:hypothetical protein